MAKASRKAEPAPKVPTVQSDGIFINYQRRFRDSVSHYAVTVVEKSRRTGFSWAAAWIAVPIAAADAAAGGDDVYYMGYNHEMAREFIGYCGEDARMIAAAASEAQEFIFHDPDKPEHDIKAFRIDFASGRKIVALPSVPRALRGMQGVVIVDEAAFHDNLEEVLKAAFALLIWGGKVVIISTHNGVDNPFNALVEDIRAGKKPGYNLLRVTFEDALKDGLYKRICQVSGKTWSAEAEKAWVAEIRGIYGDNAGEELDVIPAQGGGTYMPMALIEANAVPGIPVPRWACHDSFAAEPEHVREAECLAWCEEHIRPVLAAISPFHPHYVGGDFARIVDLSVIWPLQVTQSMQRVTPFIVELRNVPFEQQRQVLFFVCDNLPRFSGGALDAGGNGAYLAEVAWQRYGSDTIKQVKFSPEWYREQMPPFKAAFEENMMVVPRDRDIIDDLRMVKVTGGIAQVPKALRRKGADGKYRHGDAAVAAALAYFATRTVTVGYGYETPARIIGGFTDGGRKFEPETEGSLRRRQEKPWNEGAY